ncbi:subclass B3 metallo-beta-lactamase [Sphingomonas glacialis]|uniref:Subclass B3 metallo-beta-lactamase n=1 Tax=Sphingomonas glacialis TaxID=658225 RepID=A0A502FYU8_9SPHN|nr:subclass B3 metallo-beta-lactamase [Sphingomonas glacialis]TPG54718.1 subclass B3 metallo-beta-lactamase [Sphingomonas glacialis]
MIARILAALAALFVGIAPAGAQSSPAWSRPTAPFHIAGPIWYVGTEGLGVYAVVTRDGTILVSGPLAQSAGLIERNLATIGVRPRQIKWILNSHAHFDHAAAFAELRRWSGAKLVASAGDAPALRRGRHEADNENGHTRFAPVPVDRVVRDGEQVSVGGVALTAVLTPGHTPGCTTWTMPVVERGRRLMVVFPCSVTVAGNHLVGNRAYPGIVADYRGSFDRLATLPADIVLPMHPDLVDLLGQAKRRDAGAPDAFVDRAVLPRLVAEARRDFASALARAAKR